MTTTETPEGQSMKKNPIKKTARISGVLYLIIFVVAPFPFLLGRAGLIVPGDAVSTARNIMASEFLFRFGMVAEAIVFLVEIVLAALLYVLLRPVSKPLSLAAAFSRVGEAVVQAVNLLTSILVLLLLGYLVYKSEFWPRIFGILLLLAGFGYLAQSFGHILWPQFDDILSVVVIVLAVPGELAFTIWLLAKGVNVERWEQRSARTDP